MAEQRMASIPELARSAVGDTYSNLPARLGFGTNNLVNAGTYPVERISLDYMLLLGLYRSSWIIRNVVDVFAEDMLKSFPTLNCDLTPEQIGDFERVVAETGTEDKTLETLKWGRLFGGAIGLIVIDGQNFSEPLELESILPGSYRGVIPLDRWSGVNPSSELVSDFSAPLDYGLPKYYECVTETGTNYKVHHSRVMRFVGRNLPLFEKQIQSYWGLSEAEVVYEELKKYDYIGWSIASLVSRAQVMVLKDDMLAQALSGIGMTDQQLTDYILRIKAVNDSMSNSGIAAIGAESDMSSLQYSFGGLADITANQMLAVSGACQMPVSKLFGRTVTGLGQTGEGDLQNYEQLVEQKRKRELRPQLNKLFPVICMSVFGEVPDDLDYIFPAVRTMTEEGKADLGGKTVEAILSVLNSQTPLISPQTALRELKQASSVTGLFSNITDELVASSDDAVPKAMSELSMPGGEEGEKDGEHTVPSE